MNKYGADSPQQAIPPEEAACAYLLAMGASLSGGYNPHTALKTKSKEVLSITAELINEIWHERKKHSTEDIRGLLRHIKRNDLHLPDFLG